LLPVQTDDYSKKFGANIDASWCVVENVAAELASLSLKIETNLSDPQRGRAVHGNYKAQIDIRQTQKGIRTATHWS
jgi:hypothetical protein